MTKQILNNIIASEPETILSNPGKPFNYFGWPSIARLQNGELAVTCSGFRKAHVCPFGKAVMITSSDEGRTYSSPTAIIDTPLDDRDSGVVPFGDSGVIVTSFNNTREFQRKCNPGKKDYSDYLDTVTDEDERKYLGSTFRISQDCGKTFGKIHISPVTSPHGPTVLKSGKILWVGRAFNAQSEENERIEAWTVETDGKMTFVGSVPQVFRNGKLICSCEPHAIELPDGTILCQFRGEWGLFTVFQTVSRDGGATWSEPVQLLSDRGGSPPHLLLHSSGTLISSYGYREKPYGIRVMISNDLGKTWKTDIVLREGAFAADLGYPATVELRDHSLLTVLYEFDENEKAAVIKQIKWKIV